MICVASRRSGKSELIKYIYQTLDFGEEYDFITVISMCDDSLDFMSNFVHGNIFIKDFSDNIVNNLIIKSDELVSKGKPKRFLVIIDDVVGYGIKNSEAIMKLYALGRHHNISCILICQMVTLMSVTARSNSDLILIGAVSDGKEKDSVMNNLLKGLASRKDRIDRGYTNKEDFYDDLIKYNTEDYNFIVIDKLSTRKNDFSAKTFKMKANI